MQAEHFPGEAAESPNWLHIRSLVAKTEFLAFRVVPELEREPQRIADDEQRPLSQFCATGIDMCTT